MSAKALPPQPHIDWLKKTAKQRLVEMRVSDPAARLADAQHAVAQEYGFANWRALKAHVDTVSLDGRIIAAAANGEAAELARLLDGHPDKLSLTGGQWKTPLLHLAAEQGHLDCVNVVLARGFDAKTRDRMDNATAMHWAAQGGHIDVIDRLLQAGCDIDGEGDAHEIGVIGWATCFKQVRRETAEHLLAKGARPTIFSAVALGRADLVKRIVAEDRGVLARKMSPFEQHRTPLHFAVVKNQPQMAKLLLELGADPGAKDDRGNTALHYAAGRADKTMADLLIAGGADPQQREINRFESLVPILRVKSVPAAIDHYVATLGFQKEWGYEDPPTFACVARDETKLFLSQGEKSAPASVYIFVNNVDALYEDYKRRGAGVHPPKSYPWGMREIEVTDLDGNCLVIGSDSGQTTPREDGEA
jgi:uncharacterized glyoxalase superfamily protein PhnB